MATIRKIAMALLLACIMSGPIACLNINTPPSNKDVSVGGEHGVNVDHDKDKGNQPDNH